MKFTLTILSLLLFHALAQGQIKGTEWYSEHKKDGIVIQNSYNKGGPYIGLTDGGFNQPPSSWTQCLTDEEGKREGKIITFPDKATKNGKGKDLFSFSYLQQTLALTNNDWFCWST